MPIVACINVRRELFKLFYDKNMFELHSKDDSIEALDKILGCLHTWDVCKNLPPHNQTLILESGLRLDCTN